MHIRLIPNFTGKERRTGVCSLSGNPPRHSNPNDPTSPMDPVVDLDTWIDHEGNLEITLETAREIGHVVGMISDERAQAADEEIERLSDALSRAEDALQAKTAACSALATELHAAAESAVAARTAGYEEGYAQGVRDHADD